MSAEDELAERGRAIFERLRGATENPEPEFMAEPEVTAEPEITGAPDEPEAEAELPSPQGEAPADESLSEGEVGPDSPRVDDDGVPEPDVEVGVEFATEPEVTDEPGPEAAPHDSGPEAAGPADPEEDASEPGPQAAPEDVVPAAEAELLQDEEAPGEEPAASTPVEVLPEPEVVAAPPETAGTGHGLGSAPTWGAEGAPTLDDETPPPANPFVRPLPRILAIANQKGGVGKTTTAVNLGAALAELGYRVLVVDLDPQGNATTGLGVNPRNLESSVYDVIMHDTPLEDCIEPTSLRNLFVVPATIDLAGAEIELVPAFSRELKLRKALATVMDDFDFALIDCPPSLGLITVNGLAAATEVVVPIQCEYYALEGLGQLLRNVNLVQGNLNPGLEVSAIILTMYDARTKLADQVATEVRTHFGPKVCRNIVPRTVRLSEAPSFGQPIIVFDPTSRGAIAYRELAKEVSGGAPQRVG
ncbi:MAG TPA: AAA family ATPase [Acidimicrobiales bacterium]|nr:AAA family ATPase [Acidimicrobiales bacterium]